MHRYHATSGDAIRHFAAPWVPILICSTLGVMSRADIVNYTLGAAGKWDVAANWTNAGTSAHVMPGTADSVRINAAYNISLDGGAFTIGDLLLNGATLSNGTLNTTNLTTITGSALFDTAIIKANGGLYVDNGSLSISAGSFTAPLVTANDGSYVNVSKAGLFDASSIVFGNTGVNTAGGYFRVDGDGKTYTLGSGTTFSGNIAGFGDAGVTTTGASTLNSAASLTLNHAGQTTLLGSTSAGAVTVNNSGKISASAGNNLTINAQTFTNQSGGVLTLNTGTLTDNGATFTNGSGASVSLTGGAGVVLNNTTFQNSAGASFSLANSGPLTLNNATFNNSGSLATSTSALNMTGASTFSSSPNVQLASATLAGANLTGGGTFTVAGASTLSGINNFNNISYTGAGTLTQTGGMVVITKGTFSPATAVFNNGAGLDLVGGATLANSSITFANPKVTPYGYLRTEGDGYVYNLPASVTISGNLAGLGDNSVYTPGSSSMVSAATINVTNKAITTIIGSSSQGITDFTNTGAITATNGNSVSIKPSSFTNAAGGSIVQDGGTLNIYQTAFTNSNGASITAKNGGKVQLNQTQFTNNGTLSWGAPSFSGATLMGTSDYTMTGLTTVNAGQTTFSNVAYHALGGVTVAANGSLKIIGGTLDGGDIKLNGPAANLYLLSGAGLTNANIIASGSSGSNLEFDGDSSVYNFAANQTISGNFAGIGNATVATQGTATLNNAGTINISTSGANTTIGSAGSGISLLNNTGTIESTSNANLTFNAPIVNNLSGATIYDSSGTLAFNASQVNNAAGATLSTGNGGTLNLVNSTLTNNGTTSLGRVTLNTSTLTGSSIYDVKGSTTIGGSITTFDHITYSEPTSNVTLSQGAQLNLTGSTLTATGIQGSGNNRLYLHSSPTLNVPVINGGTSVPGMTIRMDGDGQTFTVAPTMTITGAIAGIGDAAADGTGKSSLINNGTILLNNANAMTTTIGGATTGVSDVTNNGTFQTTKTNNAVVNAATFTNTGIVQVDSGTTMTFTNGMAQTGGSTVLKGTINVPGGQTLALTGGSLSGSGSINGTVTNAGSTVKAGSLGTGGTSPGTLKISGDYTQARSGVLQLDFNGTTTGAFSQVKITGAATLSGELDATFNPLITNIGQSFEIMDYGVGSSGTFTSVKSLTPGYGFTLTYNTNNVMLTLNKGSATPGPESLAVMGVGFVGLLGLRNKRKRAA